MNNKILTPQEALIALAEGKKLARPSWKNTNYIRLADNGVVNQSGNPESHYTFKEFIIFEEPKPKKKYWLWDVKSRYTYSCAVYMDDNGYSDAGELHLDKSALVKKHEHLFIEV